MSQPQKRLAHTDRGIHSSDTDRNIDPTSAAFSEEALQIAGTWDTYASCRYEVIPDVVATCVNEGTVKSRVRHNRE